MDLRKQLESNLKASTAGQGVVWEKCEVTSAAKEMGLLDQIEINHPSREVWNTINVSIPDPKDKQQLIEMQVQHKSRVLMTDAEVLAFYQEEAVRRVLTACESDPEVAKRIQAAVAKPKGKKPAAKNVAKPKGKKPAAKNVAKPKKGKA